MELTTQEIAQVNQFENYAKYQRTWHSRQFLQLTEDIIGLFFGNRTGKGALIVNGYIERIMGTHPVPEKNVLFFECYNKHKFSPKQWLDGFSLRYKDGLCPKCANPHRKEVKPHIRDCRIVRFASHTLPAAERSDTKKRRGGDSDSDTVEVKNTQWPELVKWLPPFLLKDVPTTRSSTAIIKDIFGGGDIIVEFVSYKQPVGTTAGQPRMSIWGDELANEEFYDEQRPRVITEAGADIIISYTVTEETKSTVLYDSIFDRASVYYRTKTIVEDYYGKILNKKVPQIQRTDSPHSIAVMQAATDDNPILDMDRVERFLMDYTDPDVRMMRRYCIFKQISAKIFPQFEWGVHAVDIDKLFGGELEEGRCGKEHQHCC